MRELHNNIHVLATLAILNDSKLVMDNEHAVTLGYGDGIGSFFATDIVDSHDHTLTCSVTQEQQQEYDLFLLTLNSPETIETRLAAKYLYALDANKKLVVMRSGIVTTLPKGDMPSVVRDSILREFDTEKLSTITDLSIMHKNFKLTVELTQEEIVLAAAMWQCNHIVGTDFNLVSKLGNVLWRKHERVLILALVNVVNELSMYLRDGTVYLLEDHELLITDKPIDHLGNHPLNISNLDPLVVEAMWQLIKDDLPYNSVEVCVSKLIERLQMAHQHKGVQHDHNRGGV